MPRVGESMTLNVIHETGDDGSPMVMVHCPEFSAAAMGTDFSAAMIALAQEIGDLVDHYIDNPDEKLAPDALQLKRRMREWFRHEGDYMARAEHETIGDSPNFVPKAADEFAARGFERVNRHTCPECGGKSAIEHGTKFCLLYPACKNGVISSNHSEKK